MWGWPLFAMKLVEQLVTLVGHVAWPLTVVFLFLVFQKEIRSLIEQVSTVKFAGVEATFERVLQTVDVGNVPRLHFTTDAAFVGGRERFSVPRKSTGYLYDLAKSEPAEAVLGAWREIEEAIRDKAIEREIESASRQRISILLSFLFAHSNDTPDDLYTSIRDLELLRNMVVHTRARISVESATHYVRTAGNVKTRIQLEL